jgi:hypothetical protein
MLADILPTSYEIGLLDGDMADGKTIAIVGVGPVGLAALLCACGLYKAKSVIAIDLNQDRLDLAKSCGATDTVCVPPGDEFSLKVREQILEIVGVEQDGVDVVVEAVGLPGGWQICEEIVKPGGNIAVLGVHGQKVALHLERMWYRNFKMTAGMVHGFSIAELMRKVEDGSLRADKLISHCGKLCQIEAAYSLFNSRRDGALKMLLVNDGQSKLDEPLQKYKPALAEADAGSRNQGWSELKGVLSLETITRGMCWILNCPRRFHGQMFMQRRFFPRFVASFQQLCEPVDVESTQKPHETNPADENTDPHIVELEDASDCKKVS